MVDRNSTAGMDGESVPCALVVANPGGGALEVVVVFVGPREADEFASRHRIDGQVVPMRFAAELEPAGRGTGPVH